MAYQFTRLTPSGQFTKAGRRTVLADRRAVIALLRRQVNRILTAGAGAPI